VPSVRLGGMETGISEASKRVSIFFLGYPGRQASEFLFSTGKLRQGHDQSLCLPLKQTPALVYPIQMLRLLVGLESSHATFPSRDATIFALLALGFSPYVLPSSVYNDETTTTTTTL